MGKDVRIIEKGLSQNESSFEAAPFFVANHTLPIPSFQMYGDGGSVSGWYLPSVSGFRFVPQFSPAIATPGHSYMHSKIYFPESVGNH